MALIITSMMRPKNGSCSWSTACGYWRGPYDTCFDAIKLINSGATRLAIDFLSTRYGSVATASTDISCGSSSGYVYVDGIDVIRINVMKALADGAWSSSTVVNYYATWSSARAVNITAGPEAVANPAAQTVGKTASTPTSCAAAVSSGSVTVYDDGTFTIS